MKGRGSVGCPATAHGWPTALPLGPGLRRFTFAAQTGTRVRYGSFRLAGVEWKAPDSGVAFTPLKRLFPGYHGVASL